jgi:hypothetical protein
LKNKRPLFYVLGALAVAALLAWASHRTHFQWSVLGNQMRHLSWAHIALGFGLIYIAFVVRSVRWARFLKPRRPTGPLELLGTQVIGFTAVALLGRVADLTRPYLVARKTRSDLSMQVAVYTLERMFDMGSMATVFAFALLFAPDRATLPHPEIARKAAFGALLVTVGLVAVAVAIRFSGESIARWVESRLRSARGLALAAKVRAFRDGLAVIGTIGDFLAGAGLSLLMWALIVSAYLSAARAFTGSPVLASMTLARCVVMMAASMASSVVSIPVLSWFAQIFAIQQTLQQIFGVAPEPALGCAAMVLLVSFLSVVPVGLLWAHFDRISLKDVAHESEHLAEEPVGTRA